MPTVAMLAMAKAMAVIVSVAVAMTPKCIAMVAITNTAAIMVGPKTNAIIYPPAERDMNAQRKMAPTITRALQPNTLPIKPKLAS